MKKIYFLTIAIGLLINTSCRQTQALSEHKITNKQDSLMIRKIFDEALSKGESYENLRFLCKNIGARISASPQAEKAVLWGKSVMEKMGLDTVYLQPVMVPRWERGAQEQGVIISSKKEVAQTVELMALGGSVATPKAGIRAQVIEVKTFEELEELGKEKVAGKIVFFNRPMLSTEIQTFRAYGGCVNQRVQGASEAAKWGAVAVLVRSMTLIKDEHPHTGVMHYDTLVNKIPAAALSTKSAEALSQKLNIDPNLEFELTMDCQTLPDVLSYNVIGEIRGSEHPENYIIVGGHLDSWDVGEGAHDDGAGIVQSMEVLRIFKALKIKPKNTIRAVLFMNEENGAKGASEYANQAKINKETHIYAIETDAGGFTPRGFSLDMENDVLNHVIKLGKELHPYGMMEIGRGGSGTDIAPLKPQGTALIGFRPDSQRYFDVHHANTDVFEAVNQRELELGGAGIAGLIYLLDKYPLKKK